MSVCTYVCLFVILVGLVRSTDVCACVILVVMVVDVCVYITHVACLFSE